jgi:hypothetical protein
MIAATRSINHPLHPLKIDARWRPVRSSYFFDKKLNTTQVLPSVELMLLYREIYDSTTRQNRGGLPPTSTWTRPASRAQATWS